MDGYKYSCQLLTWTNIVSQMMVILEVNYQNVIYLV